MRGLISNPLLISIVVLVPCLSARSNPVALSLPQWKFRTSSTSSRSGNTCQCDCCYSVGHQSRSECIPAVDTSFDTPTCAKCSVEACAAAFPISCAQPSSLVTSSCIKRNGWMLRFVPVLFLAASIGLLLYACFIKKYDGYHDDRLPTTRLSNPLSTVASSRYDTFRAHNHSEVDSLVARSSGTLAPIAEHTEVAPDPEPLEAISLRTARQAPTPPNVNESSTNSTGGFEQQSSLTHESVRNKVAVTTTVVEVEDYVNQGLDAKLTIGSGDVALGAGALVAGADSHEKDTTVQLESPIEHVLPNLVIHQKRDVESSVKCPIAFEGEVSFEIDTTQVGSTGPRIPDQDIRNTSLVADPKEDIEGVVAGGIADAENKSADMVGTVEGTGDVVDQSSAAGNSVEVEGNEELAFSGVDGSFQVAATSVLESVKKAGNEDFLSAADALDGLILAETPVDVVHDAEIVGDAISADEAFARHDNISMGAAGAVLCEEAEAEGLCEDAAQHFDMSAGFLEGDNVHDALVTVEAGSVSENTQFNTYGKSESHPCNIQEPEEGAQEVHETSIIEQLVFEKSSEGVEGHRIIGADGITEEVSSEAVEVDVVRGNVTINAGEELGSHSGMMGAHDEAGTDESTSTTMRVVTETRLMAQDLVASIEGQQSIGTGKATYIYPSTEREYHTAVEESRMDEGAASAVESHIKEGESVVDGNEIDEAQPLANDNHGNVDITFIQNNQIGLTVIDGNSSTEGFVVADEVNEGAYPISINHDDEGTAIIRDSEVSGDAVILENGQVDGELPARMTWSDFGQVGSRLEEHRVEVTNFYDESSREAVNGVARVDGHRYSVVESGTDSRSYSESGCAVFGTSNGDILQEAISAGTHSVTEADGRGTVEIQESALTQVPADPHDGEDANDPREVSKDEVEYEEEPTKASEMEHIEKLIEHPFPSSREASGKNVEVVSRDTDPQQDLKYETVNGEDSLFSQSEMTDTDGRNYDNNSLSAVGPGPLPADNVDSLDDAEELEQESQ